MKQEPQDQRHRILNRSLTAFFRQAVRVAVRNPGQALTFLRTLYWLRRAAAIRSRWKREDIVAPPIIIFSITNRCNLHCIGCYEQTFKPEGESELDEARIRSLLTEAKELGVSFFVLAGGEPFMREHLLDLLADYPEIIFLVFTNGLLLTGEVLRRLKTQRNVVPLVSLEGDAEVTDRRRGRGVYRKVTGVMQQMRSLGIFFGTSLTLTRQNFDQLLSREFTGHLIDAGCKFFLYLEYTPVTAGTEDWVLTGEQRARVPGLLEEYRAGYPALFIAVPWDEDAVGGCLSAARGFVHINAAGDVEPCPFAPFSHTNVRELSLKDALQSDFFRAIREVPELSRETGGGCILWKERERVERILNESTGVLSETNVAMKFRSDGKKEANRLPGERRGTW